MKATRILVGLALVLVGACVLLNYLSGNRKPQAVSRSEPLPIESEIRVKRVVAPRKIPGETSVAAAHPLSPSANPMGLNGSLGDTTQPLIDAAPQTPSGNQTQWQDPDARLALTLVGADTEADLYWLGAINNPNLPAKERQDLIEDLNEEGFPDPKNVTADDLPLIMSRIELIEQLAPEAMDSVNAAAFQEAYKDLVNMYNKVTAP